MKIQVDLYARVIQMVLVAGSVLWVYGCESVPETPFKGKAERYNVPQDKTPDPISCPERSTYPFNNASSLFFGGEERVEVVVDVAVDLSCPYCAALTLDLNQIWARKPDYRDFVRVYYHHYPMEQIHPGTTEIHVAWAAVAKQNRELALELHEQISEELYFEDNLISISEVTNFVESNPELDVEKFERDRVSNRMKDFVEWDRQQCKDAGVKGTPFVYVCGELLPDIYYLGTVINSYLEDVDDES